MAAMAEIPRNRRRWVLPAALVVVGVLMMVIASFRPGDSASATWLQLGSALALFGPLYGAQRMLERRSPSESPGSSL
jgi:drug/metabolite transporter (DMT)-like permease